MDTQIRRLNYRSIVVAAAAAFVAPSAFAPSQKERPVATRFKGEFKQ